MAKEKKGEIVFCLKNYEALNTLQPFLNSSFPPSTEGMQLLEIGPFFPPEQSSFYRLKRILTEG